MKTLFAKILDSVLIAIVVFVLIFSWVRFYTHNITLGCVAGAVFGGLASMFFYTFFNKKEQKKLGKATDRKNAILLGQNLLGATTQEITDYFLSLFSPQIKSIHQIKNSPFLEYYSAQNDKHSTLHSTILLPFFDKTQFDIDDLIRVLKFMRSADKIRAEIYCICPSLKAKNFASTIQNLNITFFDQFDLYAIAKHSPAIAPITINTTAYKMRLADYLSFALDKARSRNYFLFGILLLATSLLVPFKIYYLISGTVLCLIALAVRFLPRKT